MGFGIQERRDCLAWLKWIEENSRTDIPAYLYGMSMGAATVLMAAGEPMPIFVKGVIADCGFSSAYDMILNYGKQLMRIREFPLMYSLNQLCRKKAGYDLQEYSPKEALKNCKVPVLFIHGTGDRFVPCRMTVENYRACKSRKELLLVKGQNTARVTSQTEKIMNRRWKAFSIGIKKKALRESHPRKRFLYRNSD